MAKNKNNSKMNSVSNCKNNVSNKNSNKVMNCDTHKTNKVTNENIGFYDEYSHSFHLDENDDHSFELR